jgi:hypothetical protein
MAVSVEELEGSPKIKQDRSGGSATRVFKIAWADIGAFFAELFPSPFSGYPVVAWVPGYSWMFAQSAQAEPFDPTKPGGVNVGSDITYSDTARVTVGYGPPEEDQQQQAEAGSGEEGGGGDGTGPGGEDGATGGEKGSRNQPVTLLEHSVSVGAEFLTISNLLLNWESDNVKPNENVRAGKLQALMEHQVTWHNVNQPPWDKIRSCMGCVNFSKFLGAFPECVLFLGCDANRNITNEGRKAWTLKYKFSEKENDDWTKGWNHFWRDDQRGGVSLDRLKIKGGGGGGVGGLVYQKATFTSLFNNEITAIPPLDE